MPAKTASKNNTAKTVEPEVEVEVKDKFKYYYSPSAGHMLAGFVPEQVYPSGKIKRGDEAIEFKDHWVITDNTKVHKFIESTDPFKTGYIQLKTADAYGKFESKRSRRRLGQNVVDAAVSQNYHNDQEYVESKKLFEDSE